MISEAEADRFFYKQMLSGDSTDNIPGLFSSLGVKATAKWLSPLDEMDTPEEMYSYVREVYLHHAQEKLHKKLTKGSQFRLHEEPVLDGYLLLLGTLLWIQRKEDGLWSPPFGSHAKVRAA